MTQASNIAIGSSQFNASGVLQLLGNYAGVGYTYDAINDVFVAPKPFESWLLSADYLWEAPIAYPTDEKLYTWNEATLNWVEVTS